MIDPRENTDFDPRAEIKEKLKDCGYPFEFTEVKGLKCIQFNLPTGPMSISEKVLSRKDAAFIEGLIKAAMNQDEIIKHAPKIADHENEME